jgi:hypothetical protein
MTFVMLYSKCISTSGKLEKYAWPRLESNLRPLEYRALHGRHIFQACPVWIYTQSNIMHKHHIHLSTYNINTEKINDIYNNILDI